MLASMGHWLGKHPYSVVGFVVLAILSVPFVKRSDSEWEYVYVKAAQHLRAGQDIYEPEIANAYPPFATLTALPFTYLSPAAQRGLWLVINIGCLVCMLRGAWRLAGGDRLEGPVMAPVAEHAAVFLGMLCGLFYLQNSLAHHQTDVVLGALLIGGCLALSWERSLLAATCFGLAAAVKCTPLLWVPYLLWRRRPVAAGWLLVVALGVNLLPDLVHPPASGQLWLTEYVNRYLLPLSQPDHYVGTWGSALVYNQSLSGAAQRWFVTTWEWAATDCVVGPRAQPLGPQALRILLTATELILVLLTLSICRRPFQRLPQGNESVGRPALEYSVILMLMLLFSPMSSKAHFGVLILPGCCIARAIFRDKRYRLVPMLLGALVLAFLTNKGLLGERLYTLSLWLGLVTWETLLLLAGCFALLAGADNPVPEATVLPADGGMEQQAA